MPFMNWGGQARIKNAAKDDAKAFEDETGLPVRLINHGDRGVRTDTHTTWRGDARKLRHYVDGVREEDFAAKGITVYVQAWAEGNGERLEYRFEEVPSAELCKGGWGEFQPEGDRPLNDFYYLEVYGRSEEQVRELGAEPIMVGNMCLGEIYDNGRLFFIYSGYSGASNYGHFNFPALVFEPARMNADPEYLAALAERQKLEAHDAFILMMHDRGEAAIAQTRARVDDFAIDYARAQEAGVVAKGNLDSYSKQLEALLAQGTELTDEMVEKEWNAIVANVNIERFTAGVNKTQPTNRYGEVTVGEPIDHPFLKVFTKHLWLTNPSSGRKLPLGKFEVVMNFGTNELRINNITMRQNNDGRSADHPHVREGLLCAAEYATAITTLLRDRKLASMTNMLFNILGTVTLDDQWGRNGIVMWEQYDNQLRRNKGWPEWTADEAEHPMAIDMQTEAELAAEAAAAETTEVADG